MRFKPFDFSASPSLIVLGEIARTLLLMSLQPHKNVSEYAGDKQKKRNGDNAYRHGGV